MKFRPCIDIHNGKVKQIVGGSLRDEGDVAKNNFVSELDAGFYARFYRKDQLNGGHVILLNPASSPLYEETKKQAMMALREYPGGLMLGGGVQDENAWEFLDAGASHVIVTSFVFKNGEINEKNLEKMIHAVGRERLVLDLSCRRKEDDYYIVTDRWQKFTNVRLNPEILDQLASSCDEFLIHAADVEGKRGGIEEKLVRMLGKWQGCPITYAGGVGCMEDLEKLSLLGDDHLDVTVGSALDLFGGNLPYKDVLKYCSKRG